MTIGTGSSVQAVTISQAGIFAIMAPTPVADLASAVAEAAQTYGIDPNFFLAYVTDENAFGAGNTFSARYHNLFDIVCVNSRYNFGNGPHGFEENCGEPSGNQFASGCSNPGNGWCYTQYPDGRTGVDAAFWQANRWIPTYGNSWAALLGVAGFSGGLLADVLAHANSYAAQYPPGIGPPPPLCDPPYVYDPVSGGCILPTDPLPLPEPALAAIAVGLGILGAALVFGWRVINAT